MFWQPPFLRIGWAYLADFYLMYNDRMFYQEFQLPLSWVYLA